MPGPNESQRPIRTLANADARGDRNSKRRFLAPLANGKAAAIETSAIVLARDGQSLRQLAGTIGEAAIGTAPASSRTHFIEAAKRFERANQDGTRTAVVLGDDVQAFMHAIDEVDVRSTGGAEQNSCAFRETACGVRGQVIEPKISFGFDDHPSGAIMRQHTSEQSRCEFNCGAFEKLDTKPFGAPNEMRIRRYKLEH
jgi:hypothetical protein